jgi:protein-disulfide isomerase
MAEELRGVISARKPFTPDEPADGGACRTAHAPPMRGTGRPSLLVMALLLGLVAVPALAQQRPAQVAAGAVRVSVAGAPMLGRPDAPVTLVEFSDYQCPFCQRFFLATLPTIKRDYIDAGKLRYLFLDFPLERIHPQAREAAVAAHCAGEQGKFWEMHDLLFQHQEALDPPRLREYGRRLGLDGPAFDACLASDKYAARIKQEIAEGIAAGVEGTPSFVVGKTRPGDSVEGALIVGAQPMEVFRQIIDQLLAQP